ncbi:MAG: M20/M25/M40 family metallo-hydrolase [Bacteroidales bacterium]|nr:M20/M25/M40 family metallo-hydrolase [Bacteroidales bacterium]HPE86715.1 M20/M25/M40 family metallo-hydrolase [Bacteroidales bacterium]
MKLPSILLIAAMLLTSPILFGQTKTQVNKIIETGQTDNRTMEHLDILCNRFGGRLIGSNAYDNAAEWAASKFKEWGMEVMMDSAGVLPVGFNRGPWFGKLIAEEGMVLHFATPSYTVGTKGVQRGHVLIEPQNRNAFERMKGALKGAWVLIEGTNEGWPIDFSEEATMKRDSIIQQNEEIAIKNNEIRRFNYENRNTDSVKKEEIPYLEEPALFYKEMVEAGILGIIQKSELPIRALYDRKNIDNLSFYHLPEVPDIKLNRHQYEKIYQMAKERQYFELEFDIRNHFRLGPVPYHTVIGVIPGTEYPDEYVMLGGHLDAYDVATGGVDDGNGVAVTMEAARLIMESGARPKRTILVCLWAGEEFGLLGSRSWIERNQEKLDNISNLFNRDGGPLVTTSLSVTEEQMKDFEKICEPLNHINPEFPFELKTREPSTRPEKAWGTDSGPFAVEGVPTLEFRCEDVKGYNFNYHEIWHTERDLYNKSIPEYLEHSAVVTAIVVLGIADLDHLLSREGLFKE